MIELETAARALAVRAGAQEPKSGLLGAAIAIHAMADAHPAAHAATLYSAAWAIWEAAYGRFPAEDALAAVKAAEARLGQPA